MKKSLRTIVCAAVLVGVMIIGIACTTSQKAKVANDENASKSVKIAVLPKMKGENYWDAFPSLNSAIASSAPFLHASQ